MIESNGKITELLDEIGEECESEIELFLIGGGALMHHGYKNLTKDVDFVVLDSDTRLMLTNALKKLGFEDVRPGRGYERMALSKIFTRGPYRVDLLERVVCGGFALSEGMVSRCETVSKHGNLTLGVCSLEDVFLFKSITERMGDEEDCFNLARTAPLSWDVILEEISSQVAENPEIGIIHVADRFWRLNSKGIEIPILDDVLYLYDNRNRRGIQ